MGVTGLLKLLEPVAEDVDLSEYAGLRCAIDASSWLYRGAYGCALDLAESKVGVGRGGRAGLARGMISVIRLCAAGRGLALAAF